MRRLSYPTIILFTVGLLASQLVPCAATNKPIDASGGVGLQRPALDLTFSDEQFASGTEATATVTVSAIDPDVCAGGTVTITGTGPETVAPVTIALNGE